MAELLREWIETLPQDFLDDGLYRRLEKFFYAEINSQYTSYKPAGHINESFDNLGKFIKSHTRAHTPVNAPIMSVRITDTLHTTPHTVARRTTHRAVSPRRFCRTCPPATWRSS